MPRRPAFLRATPRRARGIAAVVAAVLIAAAAIAWTVHRRSADDSAAATSVTPVAASLTTLRQSVTTTGTIAPKSRADLAFPAAGTVTAVRVAAGDAVTAGQALATMDATELGNAVQLAQATLDAASAQLTSVSSAGTDNQIAAAQAQVNAATARLATAQTALGQATLTAPFDGVVATVGVAVGDRVAGSAATGSGGGSAGGSGGGSSGGSGGSAASATGTAITVIGRNSWVVNASVSGTDLPSMSKGLQVEIVPTGATAKAFGTVSGVGVVASSAAAGSSGNGGAAAVATFPVTVDVTGTPTGLYAGGSATVTIIVKQITDALTVPTAAISTENGQAVVRQNRDGHTVTTPVTLGLVSGGLTQIVAGLQEGDEVLVEGRARTPSQQPSGSRTGGFGQRTGGFGNPGQRPNGAGPSGPAPGGGGQ